MIWSGPLTSAKAPLAKPSDKAQHFFTRHRCSFRQSLRKPKLRVTAAACGAHGRHIRRASNGSTMSYEKQESRFCTVVITTKRVIGNPANRQMNRSEERRVGKECR